MQTNPPLVHRFLNLLTLVLALVSLGAAAPAPSLPSRPGGPAAPGGGAGEAAPVNSGVGGTKAKVTPGARRTATQPKFDYSGIGGAVYATGLGDVLATVYPVQDFLSDDFYPYVTIVHQKVGEQERLLGSNREKRTVNLGRLERGEIRLIARCPDGGDPLFESGPGARNADGQAHSRVRETNPGVVELYFENTMAEGQRNDIREQHWYKDYLVVFSGAVTSNPGVLTLLEKVRDPDPATREAARVALRALSPALARQAGVR